MKKTFTVLLVLIIILGIILGGAWYIKQNNIKKAKAAEEAAKAEEFARKAEFIAIVKNTEDVRKSGIKSYTFTTTQKTDGTITNSVNIIMADVEKGYAKLIGKDTQDGHNVESVIYEKVLKDNGTRVQYIRYYNDKMETKWHKKEINVLENSILPKEYYLDTDFNLSVEDIEKVKEVETDIEGTRKFDVIMTKEYTEYWYSEQTIIGQAAYVAYVKDGYLYKLNTDYTKYIEEENLTIHTLEKELNNINNTKVEITDEVLKNVVQSSKFE